jgi:hypothetical protein
MRNPATTVAAVGRGKGSANHLQLSTRPAAPPASPETRAALLWADFLAARDLAEKSRRLEDGIRAGRSWAAFLAVFVTDAPPLASERLP